MFRGLARREVEPSPGFNLADRERAFSWFHPPDAWEAALVALGFSARAASLAEVADGLEAALADASAASASKRPGLVRQALSMFVTHDPRGRSLIKPRTIDSAPEYFSRSPSNGTFAIAIGGAAPELDYWREECLRQRAP